MEWYKKFKLAYLTISLLMMFLLGSCTSSIVLPDSTNTPGISDRTGVYHGSEYNKAFKMLGSIQEEREGFIAISPYLINRQLEELLDFSNIDIEEDVLEYFGLSELEDIKTYNMDTYSNYIYSFSENVTVSNVYGPVQIVPKKEVQIQMDTMKLSDKTGLYSELVMDISGDYIFDSGTGSVILITDRIGLNTQATGYIVDISDRLSLILLDMQDTFDFDTFNLDTLLFNSHNERQLVEMTSQLCYTVNNATALLGMGIGDKVGSLLEGNKQDKISLTNFLEIKVYNKDCANNVTFNYFNVKRASRLGLLIIDVQSKNVLLAGLSS